MSVSGPTTAIVSLGMSCQSARQIRTNAEVIGAILGEEVGRNAQFFDGLIAPPAGLARLFEDGFPLFSRDDIAEGPGHPTWSAYAIRFLHHFRDDDGADIDRFFDHDLSRFTHLRDKFLALAAVPRLVFVISNSQNNLTEVAAETAIERIDFNREEIGRLREAVQAFLGRRCEFILVSTPDRRGSLDDPDLHLLTPDDSEWTGDTRQWREVFLSRLGVVPPAQQSASW